MLGAITVNENRKPMEASQYSFQETIVASSKVNWRIEDIIGGDKKLDFSKRFMPESLARVNDLDFLNDDEKRILNQIRGHAYLSIFGLAEEFILPFVLDHVRPSLDENDYRVRAFLQFAGEEAKHIQLFKEFSKDFKANFRSECKVIGPPAEIAKTVLAHSSLGVALAILHIEWMTQRHYIDSIRVDEGLDPQFKSLLKHHWLEEAQHAKLDTIMVEELVRTADAETLEKGIDDYLSIGGILDSGVKQQAALDLEAFEEATGRTLSSDERAEFVEKQHQANRWTYLGTGMTHPRFLETLSRIDPEYRGRIESVALNFC